MPGYRGSVNIDPSYVERPAQGVYAYGPQTLVIRPKTESEILAPAMGWIQQMLPYWQEEWRAMRSQGLGRVGGTSGGGSRAGGGNAGGGQAQTQTKPRTGVDIITSTITPGQMQMIGKRAAQLAVPNKPAATQQPAIQQPAIQQPAVTQQNAVIPQTPIEQLVALENRITDEVARNIGDIADDDTVNVPTIWNWLAKHGVKFNTTPLINAENLITDTAARSIGDVADDTVNVPTVWSLLRQLLNPVAINLENPDDYYKIPNLAALVNSIPTLQLTPPANTMPVGTTTMKPNAPHTQGWGFLPNRPQEPVELPMSYLRALGWVDPNTVVRPTPFSAIR